MSTHALELVPQASASGKRQVQFDTAAPVTPDRRHKTPRYNSGMVLDGRSRSEPASRSRSFDSLFVGACNDGKQTFLDDVPTTKKLRRHHTVSDPQHTSIRQLEPLLYQCSLCSQVELIVQGTMAQDIIKDSPCQYCNHPEPPHIMVW